MDLDEHGGKYSGDIDFALSIAFCLRCESIYGVKVNNATLKDTKLFQYIDFAISTTPYSVFQLLMVVLLIQIVDVNNVFHFMEGIFLS